MPRKAEFSHSPDAAASSAAGPSGRLIGAPAITAESGGDRHVIKEGRIFFCCRTDGDVDPEAGGDGLYADDTRFVSEMMLEISGTKPIPLASSAALGYSMTANSTNREILDPRGRVTQQTLSIARNRFISGRLYEQITVTNFGEEVAVIDLTVTIESDFADTFEVRGVRQRHVRGRLLDPKRVARGFTFTYVGQDEIPRETHILWTNAPDTVELEGRGRARLTWALKLNPGRHETIGYSVEPSVDGERGAGGSQKNSLAAVRKSHEDWLHSGTLIVTDNETFNRLLTSSIRDLKALSTPVGEDGLSVITAGIPWFVAPFGRDALITCHEMLLFSAEPSRDTLKFLAATQAVKDEAWRDAEPGKILHEIRQGELARAKLIPHTPYYGSIDSTPLFLILADSYFRWTADFETIEELRPAIDSALLWLDEYGDMDGDGFIEYARRSEAGLKAQGWKDSDPAIVHADGTIAEGPIALAEVQAYAYLAKLRMADLMRRLGEEDTADRLAKEARDLKDAFNEVFWMADEGTYAVALDGEKNLVRSVTSNAGHCLYCSIVPEDRAQLVVERLMAPDMFSGWGVRTLSEASPAYNPMSYHNGSVWPHDNAIIAAGMKRYGYHQDTNTIASVLFDAAATTRESRLPELYCGFPREEGIPFVDYPVACSPQAWAAAAPLVLLQAILGISPRAADKVLTINHPTLPSWLGHVDISGLRVGDSTLELVFNRARDRTSFALMERKGNVVVSLED